jgi:aspartate/methionine/tyrosine aminotransferase
LRNNKITAANLALSDDFFKEHANLFSWKKPQGGCVGFVNYHRAERIDVFCDRLVKESGVLLLPASVYDHSSNHFRIGFGRKNMPEALDKLRDFLNFCKVKT